MHTNTITSLEKLGLSDKEAAVYNAILPMKRGTALTIALAAGIKRPTAYFVLESLRKKKLVAATTFRGVRDYRAMPLENLKYFIHAQKKTADHFLPSIQKMYNERAFKVRLRVYHGISDIKTLLEKSLREKAVMHIMGNEEQLKIALGDYWLFYNKRAGQLNIIPKFKAFHSHAALLIWHDKVVFVELGDTVQVLGFRNKPLHDLYFRLWNNY